MNRGERRRRQRENGKRHAGVVADEFGRVAHVVTGGGEYIHPADVQYATIGAKQPGKHRWMAFASFCLTDDEAMRAQSTEARDRTFLDASRLTQFGVACIDCEWPVHQAAASCPAGDEWGS